MRVLVACEFSGVVREAFKSVGHDAWSCDLFPTEIPGQHIVGDVTEVINDNWDLMIAHPPCTYLASSGARWFSARRPQQLEALEFVKALLSAPVPKIALENPVGVIGTQVRKATQIIQPWQFGHPETKATCLWLKNLPKLIPTNIVYKRNANLTPSGQNKLGPSKDRWKLRSRTYAGIAAAMAEQWG